MVKATARKLLATAIAVTAHAALESGRRGMRRTRATEPETTSIYEVPF
jgi:hypothetical protein